MKAPAATPLPGAFRRSNAITELQRACFASRGVGRPGIALPIALPPRGWQRPQIRPPVLQAASPAVPSAMQAMERAQAPWRCPAWRRHPARPGPAGACRAPKPAAALAAMPKPAVAGRGERFCSQLQDHGNIRWAGGDCPGTCPALSSCSRLRLHLERRASPDAAIPRCTLAPARWEAVGKSGLGPGLLG